MLGSACREEPPVEGLDLAELLGLLPRGDASLDLLVSGLSDLSISAGPAELVSLSTGDGAFNGSSSREYTSGSCSVKVTVFPGMAFTMSGSLPTENKIEQMLFLAFIELCAKVRTINGLRGQGQPQALICFFNGHIKIQL